MSSTKKKKTMKLGSLLEAAVKNKGLALPTTEAEIAALEQEIENDEVKFPARLLVPPDFSSTEMKFRLRPKQVVDDDAAEQMARAARGGSAIPKEIEEKMARDRKAATSAKRSSDDEEP